MGNASITHTSSDGPRGPVNPPHLETAGGRRIALLAYGTRGDIQPMIAVGDELRRRGHSVALTVNTNLVSWARRSRLEILPLPLDTERLLKSAAGQSLLAHGKIVAFAEKLGKLEREANAGIDRACAECCAGADLIVSTALTAFRADALAEATGIPHRLLSTFPMHKTGAHAGILAPVRRLPLRSLNRWSYDFLMPWWWKSFADAHIETRAALGLPRSRERPLIEGLPSVSVYSQALMPDDSDRGAQHRVTGFAQLSPELRAQLGEAKLPEGLLEWVKNGVPPIFFGFGSMPILDPKSLLQHVAEITRRRGLRALLGAGWSEFDASDLPSHVRIAAAFDHDRLLPLCRAAVHHGGAGTTAAALRAGLPSLIISCFADQPFWGWRLTQTGVGATFPYQRLSAARLDAALDRILASEVARRAQAMGEKLRAERGASNAATTIEEWLRATVAEPRTHCA